MQNTQLIQAEMKALGKGRGKKEVRAEEVKLEFSEAELEEEKSAGAMKKQGKQRKSLGINKKDSLKSFKELNISKDILA